MGVTNQSRSLAACFATIFFFLTAPSTYAQVNVKRGSTELRVEGYANITTGTPTSAGEPSLRLDAALRGLLRWSNASGPDIGIRIAVESSPEDRLDVAEASILLFGKGGRFEVGNRQGLPDVLFGYAPNNFNFTGAEFGPAAGPSLDPGGGLQTAFVGRALAAQVRELSVLGFAASLSDDRSAKALYVSPKWRGWIAGASYAPNATDPRYADLAQLGLTHDTYWKENVLHVGGSYSFARTEPNAVGSRDLRSLNVGATLVLNYDWMIGASATYDGKAPSFQGNVNSLTIDRSWGSVFSVNYNRGPWSAGAFVQRSTRADDPARAGNDRLIAFEAGLSYRASTKLRIYSAWYYFDFNDEGGTIAIDRYRGKLLLIGVRATL